MSDLALSNIHERMDSFFRSLPCALKKPYPSAQITAKNKPVADLLLSAFADGSSAELTAITQYLYHALTIKEKDVSNLIWCISLAEMHHFELVGEMIVSLGGDPRYWQPNRYYWSGGFVQYGDKLCEKLDYDILAEQEGIAAYQTLIRVIRGQGGPGVSEVTAVIERIIEDERHHLDLFNGVYDKYCSG